MSETTLAAKIITNQINQQSSILSQKPEIKMARSKGSNENKASNIKTQNNAPTSSSDQQTQASLKSQQHSKNELMLIIKLHEQKIQNLTVHLNNLEQLVHNGKVMHFYRKAPVSYLQEKLNTSNSTPDGLAS